MRAGPLALVRDARGAEREGSAGLQRRRRERLAEMVAFARARSPYYRELYRGLPDRVEDAEMLPVTTKTEMIANFDDWATDPAVTTAGAIAFVNDPQRIGGRFLDRYRVVSSSGTTGVRATYLLDDRAMAVADALRLRALSRWLTARDAVRILATGGRTAFVCATHGHFTASEVARSGPVRRRTVRLFSAHTPTPELVSGMDRFQPAILSGYGSMVRLLAAEQLAGRLEVNPVLVAFSAEGLSTVESDRVAEAFGARLHNTYAAAECVFIGHSCSRGWVHVNNDWVVLEPVDADRRPVAPGERSSGVLLTNLANRVQPILRYALDDRILCNPEACGCGCPQPAIRVEGRTSDLLVFGTGSEAVSVLPMPLAMLVEAVPGIERLQMVQTTPTTLRVRVAVASGADRDRAWGAIRASIGRHLAERGLGHVRIERGDEPIEQEAGGKIRKIIPLARTEGSPAR